MFPNPSLHDNTSQLLSLSVPDSAAMASRSTSTTLLKANHSGMSSPDLQQHQQHMKWQAGRHFGGALSTTPRITSCPHHSTHRSIFLNFVPLSDSMVRFSALATSAVT